MMRLIVLAAAVGLTLAGCASKPTMEQVVKEQAAAEKVREAEQARRAKQQQAKMEDFVDEIPKWVLEAPKPDATGIYAVGMASSDGLSVSMRKATLEAEFGLAKVYRQEISGAERSLVEERNEKVGTQQFQQVIDKLVARVPIVGYEVVRQEVKPIDGKYHAFMLLKLPYEQFNKVMQEQRAERSDAAATAVFDDLERRVRQRQADRVNEERERMEMRLKEVEARTAAMKGMEPTGGDKPLAKKEAE